MKALKLRYNRSADDSDFGWENESLPLGNGYMGANVFGIVRRERIQITENSLQNPGWLGGLNNFAELYFHFDHENVSDYERGLILDDALSYVRYKSDDVDYTREYFTSYPDKVFVMKFTASEKHALSFEIAPEIPFIKNYAKQEGDGGGKEGEITVHHDTIILSGKMLYYNILFEGQLKVLANNGKTIAKEKSIQIENADEVVLIFALGTNYKLDRHIFLEDDPKKKLQATHPHQEVSDIIANAAQSYVHLKENHLSDYQHLFSRVSVDIDGEYMDTTTDALLKASKEKTIPYLEILYFQFGRYLLISSSRKGCLPANLQGLWNCHDQSPWGSGYWHNINVQMNYWPAFNTNLLEMFEAYVDFHKTFLPKAQEFADNYIKKHNPGNFVEQKGGNGWTIGTAAYPYTISGPGGHSGPGTGGLTSKLFWEYYDFSRDRQILETTTYPVLEGMSSFLTKTVKHYDGHYLAAFSASPEQMNNGCFISRGTYYQTVGCAFDQQMIHENGSDLLAAAELLRIKNETTDIQRKQIDKYAPVNIGWSGQIKEYLEENFYGEVGEYKHRHISQLIGLYPGTVINSQTDAWLDAAKYTLHERGDQSTGWALAHRINTWARTGDGNRCYQLFKELLSHKTFTNLWDAHPPYQIDGNLGGTSGFAEMLLQSHEGFIAILPALPDAWQKGQYSGLTARGAFEVSVKWEHLSATHISVLSKKGAVLNLKYKNIANADIHSNGEHIDFQVVDKDRIRFQTKAGSVYEFDHIIAVPKVPVPQNLEIDRDDLSLTWTGEDNVAFNIYRAIDHDACYTKIAENISDTSYQDNFDFSNCELITYRVTASKNGKESEGIWKTINHSTQLQWEQYINQRKGRNQYFP